ncbi:hypothetical protein AB0L79_17775 [Streptomyces tendae]|uniref:hypothetical protein n=1 Tax=Streptomyces tendae TaxID=1932 RepID=UPI00343CFF4D
MADTTMNIPEALPLSPKVKALRKAWQDVEANLNKYRQEHSQYAPRKTLNALNEYVSHVPALREAEKALKAAEIEAVANSKPLPDRSKVLGPIEKAVEEYRRTVPALEELVTRARKAFEDGVREELVPMGRKEAQKASQARDAWEKAYKAMETARESLELHSGLFTWCVSAGDMDTHPRYGHSQGDHLEYWELTEDGRLSWEASQALDFLDWIVKVPGLIESNPNPPVVEEVNHNPKPSYFLAKDSGHEASWF